MAQDEYKCEDCGAIFHGTAELERHNRSVHSRFNCDACGETFASLAELEAHNGVSHPEKEQESTHSR